MAIVVTAVLIEPMLSHLVVFVATLRVSGFKRR
jgi:hypothetical protein